MKVKEHAEYARLLGGVTRAAARVFPWSGTVYRSAPPKWSAGREMVTGMGSIKSGARFNATDSFPAVYGSTTPELAMIESLAYQRRAGLPVARALPLVFKAIAVDVERMLDLTDTWVLTELGVTAAQLRTEAWWLARARGAEALTQAVGRAAHACGIQALMVASAHTADHGQNIIVFPDHVHSPSQMRVIRRAVK